MRAHLPHAPAAPCIGCPSASGARACWPLERARSAFRLCSTRFGTRPLHGALNGHLPRLRASHPGLLPAFERARARGSGAHRGQASAAAACRDAYHPCRHDCSDFCDCCSLLAQAASGGSSAPAAWASSPCATCGGRPRPATCLKRRALPPARRCMRASMRACMLRKAAPPAAAGQIEREVQGQRVARAWRAAAAGGCADRAAGV